MLLSAVLVFAALPETLGQFFHLQLLLDPQKKRFGQERPQAEQGVVIDHITKFLLAPDVDIQFVMAQRPQGFPPA